MSTGPQQPLYVVKQSSIHNRGVFAARGIVKGERVIEYAGEKITKAESHRRGMAHYHEASRTGNGAVYLFTLNKRYDLDGSMEWNVARLINHSCDPNCEAQIIRGRIWIVARRRISAGSELSFDYGFDLASWEDHPCRCGMEKCPGYIVARKHRPKLRRLIAERDACVAEAGPDLRTAASRRKPAKRSRKTGAPRSRR
jgi:SET domain-containing protein